MTLQLGGARVQAAEKEIEEEGSFELVAEMIENGEMLSDTLRCLVVAKLKGEFQTKSGPKRRRGKTRLRREAWRCYLWLIEKDGEKQKKDSAIGLVAQWFGVNDRTVRKWMELEKDYPPKLNPIYELSIKLGLDKERALEIAKPTAVRLIEKSHGKCLTKDEKTAIERAA